MIRRHLVFGLLLVLGFSFACQKKSSSSGDESIPEDLVADENAVEAPVGEAPADTVPGTAPDFLVGKWASDCINQPGFLQASFILQYEFFADGNANSKTLSYAGANCTKRFTKADVDLIIERTNAERALAATAPLSEAELVPLNALWFPPIVGFTFKLGKTLKDETVEMNSTQRFGDQVINSYLTIFVENDVLYFAEICSKQDLDNNLCTKIVGDSVKNRANDMSDATPFHKI